MPQSVSIGFIIFSFSYVFSNRLDCNETEEYQEIEDFTNSSNRGISIMPLMEISRLKNKQIQVVWLLLVAVKEGLALYSLKIHDLCVQESHHKLQGPVSI